ncbi:DNA glycosylase AlkZ-like family protein [Paraglaciecola psychrophila]|uniref:DNA glycosylase AlkZ-like family protein n=1 Tax=Paraglaciecola psychrophila TaxID=326544 RepID=UPI000A2F52B3
MYSHNNVNSQRIRTLFDYGLSNVTNLLKQSVNRHQVNILSPFDDAVIQRKRPSQIFSFDYQIECYVPPAKRQSGYFSLPLVRGSEFVGRLDTKIDRKRMFCISKICILRPLRYMSLLRY